MVGSCPGAWCRSGPAGQAFRSEGTAALAARKAGPGRSLVVVSGRLSAAEEMGEPLQGGGPSGELAGGFEPAVGVYASGCISGTQSPWLSSMSCSSGPGSTLVAVARFQEWTTQSAASWTSGWCLACDRWCGARFAQAPRAPRTPRGSSVRRSRALRRVIAGRLALLGRQGAKSQPGRQPSSPGCGPSGSARSPLTAGDRLLFRAASHARRRHLVGWQRAVTGADRWSTTGERSCVVMPCAWAISFPARRCDVEQECAHD